MLREQDQAQASYFGGRRPEDGRIDWHSGARAVHDLVRAVAPPYPGAFADVAGTTLRVLRTLPVEAEPEAAAPALLLRDGHLHARCGDGRLLRVLAAELDGHPLDAESFSRRFGNNLALTGTPA